MPEKRVFEYIGDMKIWDILFLVMLIGSSAVCGLVYGLFFDDLSETRMVELSFGWVFFIVTGAMGMFFRMSSQRLLIAFGSGFVALATLVTFYTVLWDSL